MANEELLIRSGAEAGRRLPVAGETVFGREGGNAESLGGDPQLSRRHARIFRDSQGRLVLEDLGSANGTWVNGAAIRGAHLLSPGDRVRLGGTELEVHADDRQPAGATVGAAPAGPTAPLPSALPPAAGGGSGGPWVPVQSRSGRGGRTALIVLLVVAVLAGAGVGIYFGTKSLGSKSSASSAKGATGVPSDCGKNLGGGEKLAMVAYVESNTLKGNSIIEIPYRASDLKPLAMSQCPTGGTGSADLTDSGVLDANNQIAMNADHTQLFAVNQGSDTIAVFHVASNGALTPVDGSPFPSGGMGPAALGIDGDTLIVTNKAQDGVRDLSKVKPVYTSMRIDSQGRLKQIAGSSITADLGASPTDAYVPPQGGVVFSTEESGPLRGFSIGVDGKLDQASDSPKDLEKSDFAAGFDPKKKFALGIVGNPKQKLLYIDLSTIPAVAVYRWHDDGTLSYVRAVLDSGSYLPCWNEITPDGKWLYTINADTDNVTVFDLSDPEDPQQIQTFAFEKPGNPWNAAIDDNGRFLVVNTPRDTLKTPEGEGNTQHVLRIGGDGKLTQLGDDVKLPVASGVNPQGLALLTIG
jgi:6-phosphogluconolactonase (cycloisomerase 2 family)